MIYASSLKSTLRLMMRFNVPHLSICMSLQHFGCTWQKYISCFLDLTLFLFDFVCEYKHHNQRLKWFIEGFFPLQSSSSVVHSITLRGYLVFKYVAIVTTFAQYLGLDCNAKTCISPPPQIVWFSYFETPFFCSMYGTFVWW
jgi:hypothetical protein